MGYTEEDATAGDALTRECFLITSACMNDYGVYSADEKFSQLLQTIHSVRKFAGNVDIVLVESSMQPMPMSMLKNLAVWEDLIYYQCAGDYRLIGQDKKIDTNQFFAKTFGELVALEKFFDYLNRNNKYDRLFKLSGRYALTEIWNRAHYDNKDVVVRSPWFWSRSPKDPSTKGGTYSTKFWSWHHDTSPVVYEMIRDMFDQTIAMFRERGEIVILEHQLYLGIQKYHLPCRELSVLGIQGYYGQNGHFVCE